MNKSIPATIEKLGLVSKTMNCNWTNAELYETSVARGEGKIAQGGPLVVETGVHTGRSALDKFIVRDETTENAVWWGNNASMTAKNFENLWQDFKDFALDKELFVQELFGGADLDHRLPVQIVTEFAWHSLFIRHLLRIPATSDYAGFAAEFTVIDFPNFKANAARHGSRDESETIVAVNLEKRLVLIGGTSYAGEIKKSVFSILNYLLPKAGVMPMHCSVNVGDDDDSAIFFGLSGTGKTTLSADPNRTLIGDDEHGWSENGLFNFEGGCYAKMIRLSEEAEPEIYATSRMWGTVLENVVMDPDTRELDLDDAGLAENSRAAYPLTSIPNASSTGRCGQPKNLIMLTADAFGILPPIAKLTPSEAMYHFLSGYTAKVAGTEKGVTEPTATFSACYGAPFMPRHPSVYGNLLRNLIARENVNCWLVNTGWTSGPHGTGHRMPIRETRALLKAALDGSLNKAEFRKDSNFGFMVPVEVNGVSTNILDPRGTWNDTNSYDEKAAELVEMFVKNFDKFTNHVDAEVLAAAPKTVQP
ncbi:MAG: phosphoenolpyruvate carboxykinase [Robiginitomaculum sp.]|nr:phosphoenolpyruvate carboxykinase [Robiginitomaculum sp.]